MRIVELQSVNNTQVSELLMLMKELTPDLTVTAGMLQNTVASSDSHLFAVMDEKEHIVGCATLCVYDSPTGRKACVEDVVVLSSCRGRHLGRALIGSLIDYACRELKDVDLYLTSRPARVAANNLYKSLGFSPKETNVYKMSIREGRQL